MLFYENVFLKLEKQPLDNILTFSLISHPVTDTNEIWTLRENLVEDPLQKIDSDGPNLLKMNNQGNLCRRFNFGQE